MTSASEAEKMNNVYTWEEIARHDKDDDCWVVMYDKVLDVTSWLNEHPGGLDPIKDMAGQDITNSFESIGHSSTAMVKSKSFIVGRVDPACRKAPAREKVKQPAPRWSDMDQAELRKYKAGGDIIPIWVIVAAVAGIIALIYWLL